MIKKQDLPEGWKIVKLKDAIETIENGNRPRGGVKNNSKDGIPSIGGEHLDSNGGFNFEKIKFIPRDFYDSLKRGKIKRGDVLVVKDGATTGKTSFVDKDFPYKEAAVNEHIFILRGKKEIIDQKFLFYHLFSPIGQKQIKADFHGAAIGGINTQFVKNYNLVLPPLPTQKKIVSILEKAEKLKKLREEANKLTDDYLKSVFLEMFGDPIKNEKGWEAKRLEELSEKITDGKHGDCRNQSNSGYYFISAKDLKDGVIDYSEARQIVKEDFMEVHKRTNLELNDVLISNSGTIGKVAIANDVDKVERTTFQKSVAIIKNRREVLNSQFLKYVLELTVNHLINQSSGSSQKNLLLRDIKNHKIIIPPIELQNKFAEIVERVERMKEYQKQSGQQIEDLFNALMQKTFRGELVC